MKAFACRREFLHGWLDCVWRVFMSENDIVMGLFYEQYIIRRQSDTVSRHNTTQFKHLQCNFYKWGWKALYLCIELCRFQCSKIFLVARKIELNIRKKVSNYSLMICLSNPWSTLYILETQSEFLKSFVVVDIYWYWLDKSWMLRWGWMDVVCTMKQTSAQNTLAQEIFQHFSLSAY